MTPSNRLATHLADVKNADKAHRLIRTEDQQKLEALTRLVCELFAEIEALKNPTEPCEVCGEPECPA